MAKKFFLRTKETKGRASLYIEVRKRTPNIRALVCTNIPVDIQTWTRVNWTLPYSVSVNWLQR